MSKLLPQIRRMFELAGDRYPLFDYTIAPRELSQVQYNDKKTQYETLQNEKRELEEYNKAHEEALEINKKIDELDRRGEIPIAWGEIKDGRMIVDCPICGDEHSHGTLEGVRVPHCSNNITVKDNDPVRNYKSYDDYDEKSFWLGDGILTRKHKGAPVNKYYYPPTMYEIRLRKKSEKKLKKTLTYVG